MNKNEKTNIIIQSFLAKVLSYDAWKQLNKDEILHVCKFVDYEKIPERVIADNEEIYSNVDWDRVDRMKIVRLVARNVNICKFIDLESYNYSIFEVKNMLKIHPQLIYKLNIDINNINHRDAFVLLTIGNEELSEMIDVRNFDFTPKEVFEILEFNNFNDKVMREINLKDLKDYHICDIIKNTGDVYFELLDLGKLTARKWLEILEIRPNLFDYCDIKKFESCDIFNSIELICLFPYKDLDYLIKKADYQQDVSAFGWEKLIIAKPNEFIDICSYWKLNETNWKNIADYHPHLIAYKT